MRVICVLLATVCSLLATGASAQQASSTATAGPKKEPHYDTGTLPKPAPGTTLRGAVVYVYSFLDARMDAIGPSRIAQFRDSLVKTLNAAAVQTEWLSSTGAVPGGYAPESSRPEPKWLPNFSLSRQPVAVTATIAGNRPAEEAAGARYRLILFPNYSSEFGYSSSFDVDWKLIDIASGKVIWVFDTTTWYSSRGKPRLTRTIDNAMASLKKAGLVS